MSADKKKEPAFEQGLARLEELVEKLEDGELGLDESLSVFEEGIRLTKELNKKLDQAEKKLELLLKDENGEPRIEDFALEPGE